MSADFIDTKRLDLIDQKEFERAVISCARNDSVWTSAQKEKLLTEALSLISDSEVLGARDKDRRASMLLASIVLDAESYERLAVAARAFTPSVRNATSRSLPPHLRRFSYYPDSPDGVRSPQPLRVAATHEVSKPPEQSQEGQVLLIGTYQEHVHNTKLLNEQDISCIRAKSPGEALALLSDSTIAIVIARSTWTSLPLNEHQTFLERICGFSSFAFIKADTTGFAAPREFNRICAVARCAGPEVLQVSHGDSSNVTEADLPRLSTAAHALGGRGGVRLYPIDIPPVASRLLIAAVGQDVDHRNFPNVVHLQTIGTKTIQGGKSQALLVQAHPNDGGLPLVIKVAPLGILREEMGRFASFIKPWDQMLNPRLHYHGDAGLITFGIVDTPDLPGAAAPTLEAHLEQCLRSESGNPAPSLGHPVLIALVDRIVQKLLNLNSRPCTNTSHSSLAWMTLEPVDDALIRELKWTFPGVRSGKDPLELARSAISKLSPHANAAVVHGDLHLRNILVRDEREPFLIDYSYSGPGHPCFDLAWFESAVFFRFFRALGGEERLTSLFLKMLQPTASVESLVADFSDECAPVTNRVALHAAIACRNAAQKLLERHSLPPEQYLLMKIVVACQSLIRIDVQAIVVRAMITALSNTIEESDRHLGAG
jgi:hypothetical protein